MAIGLSCFLIVALEITVSARSVGEQSHVFEVGNHLTEECFPTALDQQK
ncbi:MAG: hypothetical protein ABF968_10740 [Acetobacter sp.]